MLRSIKEDAHNTFAQETAERNGFEERNYAVWKEPLDLLELFLLTTIELGDDFNHKYRPEAAKTTISSSKPSPGFTGGMPGGPRDSHAFEKWIRRWRQRPLEDAPRDSCHQLSYQRARK